MSKKISRKERNLKFETLQLHVGQETAAEATAEPEKTEKSAEKET